jgi:exopolysaccharide biosynthesis protein
MKPTFLLLLFCTIKIWGQSDSIAVVQAAWQVKTLAKGIRWQHFHFDKKQLFASNQNIHFIKLKNKKRFAFASGGDSLFLTSRLAHETDALAAVNGSFFDTKNGGAVDFIKIQNQVFDTTFVNKGRLAEHQKAAIVLQKRKLLIINGDSANTRWANEAQYSDVMVTGPLLMWQGKAYPLSKTPFNDNRHPRTCACVTHNNEVILLTADGRTPEAQGLSLPELTQLLQWLGCRDAVNLDGGGSTTMYIQGEPHKGVVNMPCDNKLFDHAGERKVSNIVVIKK